ncbi:lipoate--protein ligase [Mycoplasmopsis cricetuli]|uniref:lipoate--protein ligase n=1 Tax=Mycoplasmopsis cricetuli TaxID=171283 RepID=UPI00046EB70E|nr:lipoate--protein ligase [Mycoplasmopsis cricetuli]
MKLFLSKETSPYFNLSLEELIATDSNFANEDVVFLYQHDNAVIIGKNQNAYEEIKRDYIKENKIELSRRISGGGAVYHDLGNVNFSFITNYNKDKTSYQRFLAPIIGYLNSLGLNAEFKGRNDLLCNGAKISGNAQFIKGKRIVSHGTLLFDVDLTKLVNALNPSKLKIQSKGIQSVRQRVTNIAKELNYSLTVEEFISGLVKYFVEHHGAKYEEIDTRKYQPELDKLISYRASEQWIYGTNPIFNVQNVIKYPNGILKVKLNIEHNKIKEIAFEGDFLSKKDLNDVIELFKNIEYKKEAFAKVLDQIDLNLYFGGIEKEEILTLVFG